MFMPVDVSPSLHDRVDMGSHAHPSPLVSPRNDQTEQNLRDLLAGLSFDVELRGLAIGHNAAPHSMRYTQLRQSEYKPQVINHLDVVSTWKGISNAQALELTLWERKFQQCLILYIEERLRCAIATQLSKCKERVDAITLLPRLVRCLPEQHVRYVEVDIPRLVHSMINSFYEDHPSLIAARNFRWSIGSGDLPSFVYNFLTTHDCFQHKAGPCLFVKFTCDLYTYPILSIVADVGWQPPDIRFDHLPTQLELGEQYSITPYRVRPLGMWDTSGYKSYPDQVHYTIQKSSSPEVYWNPEGKSTQFHDLKPTVATTEFSAWIVTQFPDDVRFERTSRWDIRIGVVETRHPNVTAVHLSKQESGTSNTSRTHSPYITPLSKTRQDACYRALTLVALLRPETVPQLKKVVPELNRFIDTDSCTHKPASQKISSDSVMHDVPMSESEQETTSPKKRKGRAPSGAPNQVFAWNTFTHDPSIDLKRRKFEQAENPSAHINMTFAGDLHRMAAHLGVADPDPSADQDPETKTVADALRMLLDCIEKVKPDDQHSRHLLRRLSGPIMEAAEIAHRKEIFEQVAKLTRSTKKMDEMINEGFKILKKTRPQLRHLPTPPRLSFESGYSDAGSKSSSGSDDACDVFTISVLPKRDRSAELLQEEIQRNYREFEEKARRKSVGDRCDSAIGMHPRKNSYTMASTDTVGDMDFERIFLGDSDGEESWPSSDNVVTDRVDANGDVIDGEDEVFDVNGLSEDMDGFEVEIYEDEMEKRDGITLEKRLGYWDGTVA